MNFNSLIRNQTKCQNRKIKLRLCLLKNCFFRFLDFGMNKVRIMMGSKFVVNIPEYYKLRRQTPLACQVPTLYVTDMISKLFPTSLKIKNVFYFCHVAKCKQIKINIEMVILVCICIYYSRTLNSSPKHLCLRFMVDFYDTFQIQTLTLQTLQKF